MNIPESIASITSEKINDAFNPKSVEPVLDLDEVILSIKRSLNLQQLEKFEKGLIFFKTNIGSDKNIAQNIISLISEVILTSLKDSKINEEYKNSLALSVKHNFNSILENLESLFGILTTLNKNNNLLDVREFTLIILGYAIGLLKKIYNSRN